MANPVNLIQEVEEIEKYMRTGMREGVQPLAKFVPVLFHRIKELEGALAPFARVGTQPSGGKDLVLVYHKDCVTAYKKLSKAEAVAKNPTPEEYLPAERS